MRNNVILTLMVKQGCVGCSDSAVAYPHPTLQPFLSLSLIPEIFTHPRTGITMDPLTALGLASNIVQFVDFASKLISQSHEIYRSADGALEDNVALEHVAKNLSRLGGELKSKRADIKTGREALARERQWAKEDGRVIPEPEKVTAGKQLQQLSEECSAVSNELLQELEKLKIKGPHKRWESFRQALNSVWSQKKIRALETGLEGIRKQLDTTLLVCLRYGIAFI